jgi:hypothetical protein
MAKAKTARSAGDQRTRARQPEAATPERAGDSSDAGLARRYTEAQGICQTCVHRPRCLFFKAARRPIQFCDEFDDHHNGVAPAGTDGQPLLDGHSYEQGPPPGICVNCDHRLSCMHRKPNEPVLECEDYQ